MFLNQPAFRCLLQHKMMEVAPPFRVHPGELGEVLHTGLQGVHFHRPVLPPRGLAAVQGIGVSGEGVVHLVDQGAQPDLQDNAALAGLGLGLVGKQGGEVGFLQPGQGLIGGGHIGQDNGLLFFAEGGYPVLILDGPGTQEPGGIRRKGRGVRLGRELRLGGGDIGRER